MTIFNLPPDAAQWAMAVWIVALGGVVGSFLNVVVYRLPAGLNIAWPGSFCPLCHHPIRWFDNVPVLGWMLLGGRCRDCRAPISIRYPTVEAITAVVFFMLALDEIFRNGVNLPPRAGVLLDPTSPLRPLAELCAIWALHAGLICTLLTAALIAYDGHRPPRRLFVPILLVGLLAPTVWPVLHPVSAWPGLKVPGFLDSAVGSLVGFALGKLLLGGWATWLGSVRSGERSATADLTWSSASVGLVLGWQAVCVVAIFSAVVHQLLRLTLRQHPETARIPASAWLCLATLLWIVNWARIVSLWTVFQ